MDEILEKIFKDKKADKEKLLKYGFVEEKHHFFYQRQIMDGEFNIVVKIKDNHVEASVCEIETGELYTLHLSMQSQGAFVGKVRQEYLNLLSDIGQKCFDYDVFHGDNTLKIIEFVKREFNSPLEFLWPKFSNNAICRRSDNQKWFILFIKLSADKIGLAKKGEIEIIDIRIKCEQAEQLIDNKIFFPAYHMNKKSWITIKLDSVENICQVYDLIRKSYELALK